MSLATAVIALVPAGAKMKDGDLEAWASAFAAQLLEDVWPAWGIAATCRFVTKDQPLAPGEWPHYLVDVPGAGDPADALAFHLRLPDGTPAMRTFVGLAEQYGQSASQSASHENVETLIDQNLNECVQSSDGSIWAREACDACEAIGYSKNGVTVSDFCTPFYFAPPDVVAPGATYNFLRTITAPFQILPGGYGQTYEPDAGWTQRGAASAYRSFLKSIGVSRSSRR